MKLFEDGDPCFAPMLNALFAAFRGTAVMSGCEVSATGTSRTVSITAGSVQINGEVVAVSAGSVTLDAGSTFDRYDLVSVNASGSKIVTKGTTKRKCPTQPANTCLLAIVFVPAGATVIATGDVYDARLLSSLLAAREAMVQRARGAFSGIIELPPTAEKYTVPVLETTETQLYSSPGAVQNQIADSIGTLAKSYTLPTDLTAHGIESPYRLIKIRISYAYTSGNTNAFTRFLIDGVRYAPAEFAGVATGTRTIEIWISAGTPLQLYVGCTSALNQAAVSNFTVTLLGAYPFGDILAAQYGTLCAGWAGQTLPYDVTDDTGLDTTFTYDGYVVPKADNRAYFPTMPTQFSIAFAPGVTAVTSAPSIVFWRMPIPPI